MRSQFYLSRSLLNRIQNPVMDLQWFLAVNYFHEKNVFKCLTRFWKHLWYNQRASCIYHVLWNQTIVVTSTKTHFACTIYCRKGRPDKFNASNTLICEFHFKPSDINISIRKGKKSLKRFTVHDMKGRSSTLEDIWRGSPGVTFYEGNKWYWKHKLSVLY